jgi:hypothetical protein
MNLLKTGCGINPNPQFQPPHTSIARRIPAMIELQYWPYILTRGQPYPHIYSFDGGIKDETSG